MSDLGFVGLDPREARDLAADAGVAADTAGHIASEVAGVLTAAEIPDNGFAALCAEVSEELGLLRGLLAAKATDMELAAAGIYINSSADESAALWASLLDEVGEGVDFNEDRDDDESSIPLSASVAAAMLAQYLSWMGDEDGITIEDLMLLVDDPTAPQEVRAAAQFFELNGELWSQVGLVGSPRTVDDFTRFVATNAALAVFARNYDRFDTAAQDAGTGPDGEVSREDLEAVANDTTGAYSDAEREAARYLLERFQMTELWAMPDVLTYELAIRQVFAEDPVVALEWLRRVEQDPERYVPSAVWFDPAVGRSWLSSALASTSDPAEQTEIIVGFAAVYQATEPDTALEMLHSMLDGLSWIDPTQVADGLNAVIYAAEGDGVNAVMSGAGIFLPLGGGGAIRLTKESILALAARQGDEAVEAALKQAIRNGDITPEMMDEIVVGMREQFDDDVADGVRRYLDDLQTTADDLPPAGAIPGVTDELIGIPDAKRLSAVEQATAARMGELPELAGRTLRESEHVGAEYVDDLGRTYDQLGNPRASQYWNEQQFLGSIDDHLRKSNDFTVVDLTGFTDAQKAVVRDHLDAMPEAARAKFLRVGF